MKNERKLKFSKFKVAKINNLQVKGGVESNACATVACMPSESCDTECKTTTTTRPPDSL